MKFRYVFVALAILVLLFMGFRVYSDYRFEREYNNAQYCYFASFGGWSYKGVPNKICSCDGKLIDGCRGAKYCDETEVRCSGTVTGTKYVFRDYINGQTYYKELDTFEEYDSFCNSLDSEPKERCLQSLNLIKAVENKSSQ